jgi:hypothetical protein
MADRKESIARAEALGFTLESAVAAVEANDLRLLKHSGKMRVPLDPAQTTSDAVTVAYVHQNGVTYSWHHSMVEMVGYDLSNSGRIMAGGYIAMRCGSDGLVEARNRAVRHFLEDKPADWFFWIDTDMGFEPDTVDRLLEAADPVERPIVGALCFSMRETHSDEMGGWRTAPTPTIFDWAHLKKVKDAGLTEEMGFAVRWDYPPDTLVRCTGTGSACILIHRSVFERIEEAHGPIWYNKVPNTSTGQIVSEDLSFCLRAGALNIPVYVHTGVRTTHLKPAWVAEEDYWLHRAVTPAPGTVEEHNRKIEQQLAEPAWMVPRFAIIPTHNRPARLLSLVSSLGTQCDTIVVLDNASDPPVDEGKLQAAVPEHVTVSVIRDEQQPPHLSRFWNVMYDRCAELATGPEWDVASFNDDAVVPAGWYNTCATALREHDKAVVAHTGTQLVAESDLLDSYPFDRHRRMTPWAHVVKGEAGLRADESMHWWYFDDDFCRQAIDAGGVLAVPGPLVVNAGANSSTVGALAEQAQRDQQTFAAKWGGNP